MNQKELENVLTRLAEQMLRLARNHNNLSDKFALSVQAQVVINDDTKLRIEQLENRLTNRSAFSSN